MRKQTILLVTTFIFALILCGVVAAEDPQGDVDSNPIQMNASNSNSGAAQDDSDPRIHGTVKEIYNASSGTYTNLNNAIPVKGAKITIKNPANGSTIATGTTNSQGKYDISPSSGLKSAIPPTRNSQQA